MTKKDKEVMAYQRKKISELEDKISNCKYKLDKMIKHYGDEILKEN